MQCILDRSSGQLMPCLVSLA